MDEGLVEVVAAAQHRGVKRKRGVDKDFRCRVCGKHFAERPNNSAYCYPHKQCVDAMTRDYKNQKHAGNPAPLNAFETIRDAAGEPPSPFSNAVLQFDVECPSPGAGAKRKSFDIVGFCESERSFRVLSDRF